MQLGYLNVTAIDAHGNVRPLRRLRVVNYADESPAKLYADETGQTPLQSNILTADSKGNAFAYCIGRFKVFDVLTDEMLVASVTVAPDIIVPVASGATCDGLTDDIGALYSTLNRLISGNVQGSEGNRVALSLGGRLLAISEQFAVSGIKGLRIKGGALRAIGTWGEGVHMVRAEDSAVGMVLDGLSIDCNRRAAGVEFAGAETQLLNSDVFNFRGRGVSAISADGESRISNSRIYEWKSTDPEFLSNGGYQAEGVFINAPNCHITGGSRLSWAGLPLHLGQNCVGLVVDAGARICNGGNSQVLRVSPKLVRAEKGSSCTWLGMTFEDGSIDLYSPQHEFTGCRALQSPSESYMTYFMGLYANGQDGPFDFGMDAWQVVSPTLLDGTIPFISFFAGTNDVGQSASWPGSYDAFVEAIGRKAVAEGIEKTRTKATPGFNEVWNAPGPGGSSGAGLGLRSASTPPGLRADPAGLRETAGYSYLYRPIKPPREIAASSVLTINDSGELLLVKNGNADISLQFPPDARPGWHLWLDTDESSAGTVTMKPKDGFDASSMRRSGVAGNVVLQGPDTAVFVMCTKNVTGDSATFLVSGAGQTGKAEEFATVVRPAGSAFITGVDASRQAGDRDIKVTIDNFFSMIRNPLRIDPSKYPFFMDPLAADSTAGLQAIIDALHVISSAKDIDCTLELNQMWRWSSLKLYDTVNLECPSLSDSGGYQVPGAVGPMLELNGWDGRKGGVRRQQRIKGRFDGQLSGVVKATGATAAGSNQLTGITPSDITAVGVDWFVEGIGIPPLTTVTGFGAGRTSLTLSANAVGANGPRNKIVFRPTIKRAAVATANSAVLAVADTTGIVPGMRVYGSPLETDGDDLNQWSRVKSVVANTSVTLDRQASGSGAFQCYFYIKNEGILLTEAASVPGYDGTREYGQVDLEVHVTQMSGHGICARPGRDQIHLKKPSKIDACYGGGLVVTACHDCWFEVVGGSHWEECVLMSSSSTPQFGGTDQYQTYLTDRCYDMRWQGIRECNTYNLNINGRFYFKGKNGEVQPIITLVTPMFKFTLVNMVPYGDTDAYIVADNAIVNMVGGGFKGDRTAVPANQGRPKWIGRTLNGGIINITGTNWPDNPTTDQPATVDGCPYSVAITNEGRLYAQRVNNVTGRLTQFETNFVPTLSAAVPGDLSCAYTTQYGFLAVQNGMAYVDIQLEVTPTATTASGNLEIRGLPVPPNADRSQPPLSVIASGAALDFGTGYTQLMAHASGQKVILDKMGDNKAGGSVTVANIVSGQPISINVFGWFKV